MSSTERKSYIVEQNGKERPFVADRVDDDGFSVAFYLEGRIQGRIHKSNGDYSWYPDDTPDTLDDA